MVFVHEKWLRERMPLHEKSVNIRFTIIMTVKNTPILWEAYKRKYHAIKGYV